MRRKSGMGRAELGSQRGGNCGVPVAETWTERMFLSPVSFDGVLLPVAAQIACGETDPQRQS